ncbi:prolipoprotein diacylglyceryl transferase family protein [Amycolatopsis sp. NPDC059021]|uniref:prolipoprotein diacylglyceryl transferase family protein n=1 Tax=Amycolatopsis sp. NPDC059021 TaxID=3346704 RepID=UPI00366EA706
MGPRLKLGSRLVGSWEALLVAACVTGTAVWTILGTTAGLPATLLAGLPVAWAAAFALAWHRMRRAPAPRFIFHRHAAVGLAMAVLLAQTTGARSPVVLDVWAIASAAGLAVGRVGCHRGGCCAGRPARIGPRYPMLGGDRHLPVQLLESAWCLTLAVAACACQDLFTPGVTGIAVICAYVMVRVPLQRLRQGTPHS